MKRIKRLIAGQVPHVRRRRPTRRASKVDPGVSPTKLIFFFSVTGWLEKRFAKFWGKSMFVERKVCYSALFTNLVGWRAGAVSFPQSDVILAQLACPPE